MAYKKAPGNQVQEIKPHPFNLKLFIFWEKKERNRKKEKETLNIRYCLRLTEVGFFTYQC